MNNKCIDKFTDEQLQLICSWFSNGIEMAHKLTTGNVAHQAATIAAHNKNCLWFIADYMTTDSWHHYEIGNATTAPEPQVVVLTKMADGSGIMAQCYNKDYMCFEDNNLVEAWKYIKLL